MPRKTGKELRAIRQASSGVSSSRIEGVISPENLGRGVGISTKFLRGDSTWQDVAGGSPAWGSITGTLSSQTDLQTALDGKAATSHNHSGVYANVSHTHAIADVTNLQTTLDGKASTSHTHALDDLTDVATAGQTTGSLLRYNGSSWVVYADSNYATSGHTHAQLHDRSHAMTSTSDHTAGNWKVFYSNGSGQLVELALGGSGTYLQSNGASSAPTFASVATNPWTMVMNTSDQTVTNSAVLVTGMTVALSASTNYHIRIRALLNSGNANADIKYRTAFTGTVTRVRRVRTYSIPNGTSAVVPTIAPSTAFDTSDQTLLATVTGDSIVYEDIYVQVNGAGDLNFQFAQNTQTAAASVILYEGSYIEYATT